VIVRALGIDYGGRRTGIAIGDTETRMALPFEMFEGLPDTQLAQAIARLVKREAIETLVIGLPLHADGAISQQSKLTERFILTLQQTIGPTPPIHRFSEYLSTHDSESKLAGHFTRQQKRQRVDALAAARILQDFLDQQPRP
jgi:putative Holliday junction resolvase